MRVLIVMLTLSACASGPAPIAAPPGPTVQELLEAKSRGPTFDDRLAERDPDAIYVGATAIENDCCFGCSPSPEEPLERMWNVRRQAPPHDIYEVAPGLSLR